MHDCQEVRGFPYKTSRAYFPGWGNQAKAELEHWDWYVLFPWQVFPIKVSECASQATGPSYILWLPSHQLTLTLQILRMCICESRDFSYPLLDPWLVNKSLINQWIKNGTLWMLEEYMHECFKIERYQNANRVDTGDRKHFYPCLGFKGGRRKSVL